MEKTLSKAVSGLPASAALQVDLRQKALRAAGRDIISFCVGEPDFPTPPAAAKAGLAAIAAGDTKYTNAAGTPALRRAIALSLARDYGLAYAPEEIVVTPGTKFAVHAAFRALLDSGDGLILPAPYYTSHYYSVLLAGAEPQVVFCGPETGFKLTPEHLEAAIRPGTKAILLNNPANPSGAVYSKAELNALSEIVAAHDLFVVTDEIYGKLVYTPEPFCAFASLGDDARARTVTINGVSKTYAMTGWRIGFLAAPRPVAAALSAFLSHTTGSSNSPAQAAAAAALLGDQSEAQSMLETFRARRDVLLLELSRIPGLRFSVPEGAFYTMLDVRKYLGPACPDDTALALRLLEEAGVALVPCADYGAPGYLRLSFTLPEAELIRGIARIGTFFNQLHREGTSI